MHASIEDLFFYMRAFPLNQKVTLHFDMDWSDTSYVSGILVGGLFWVKNASEGLHYYLSAQQFPDFGSGHKKAPKSTSKYLHFSSHATQWN